VTVQALPDMYRGDSKTFSFTFKDDAGSPIDISGQTLWFTLKANQTDSDPGVLQQNVTFPTDSNSAAGIGSMVIPASATGSLTPGTTYYYDFQLVDGTYITTLGSGTVTILQDITISTS
jgi:hypothetical protein